MDGTHRTDAEMDDGMRGAPIMDVLGHSIIMPGVEETPMEIRNRESFVRIL